MGSRSTIAPFSDELNQKLDAVAGASRNKSSAARLLGLDPGSLGQWLRTRSSGAAAARRIEAACDRVLSSAGPSIADLKPRGLAPGEVRTNGRYSAAVPMNEELAEKIELVTSSLGSRNAAGKVLGVSPSTIERWLRRRAMAPGLVESVGVACDRYLERLTSPDPVVAQDPTSCPRKERLYDEERYTGPRPLRLAPAALGPPVGSRPLPAVREAQPLTEARLLLLERKIDLLLSACGIDPREAE
jgi:DNA-binding transcriptional regulator YdaS (Cro superfamily)